MGSVSVIIFQAHWKQNTNFVLLDLKMWDRFRFYIFLNMPLYFGFSTPVVVESHRWSRTFFSNVSQASGVRAGLYLRVNSPKLTLCWNKFLSYEGKQSENSRESVMIFFFWIMYLERCYTLTTYNFGIYGHCILTLTFDWKIKCDYSKNR